MAKERLQKILSRSGYGSRRDCEKIIAKGRVYINQLQAKLGDSADPDKDKILVDGKIIKNKPTKLTYIVFYKPKKVLSVIKKIDNRKVVSDYLPMEEYLFIVGRLDYESEGLILLTNDGDVANKLTHPRYEHEKEYYIELTRPPDEEQLNIWRRGVVMEDGYRTLPARVEVVSSDKKKHWIKIVMREGKKRQIREIGKRIGLPVKRIIRTRIATIELGLLKPGEWRYLSSAEIAKLKEATEKGTNRVVEAG